MKVIFFHNKAMWYRISFFKEFAKFFETEFYFFQKDNVKDLKENVHVKINIFRMTSRLFKRNYDVVINSNWDSLNDLLRLFISFIVVKVNRKKFVIFSEEWGVKTSIRKFAAPIINLITKNSDALIVPGKKHKQNLLAMGVAPVKIFIAPNSHLPRIRQGDSYKAEGLKKQLGLSDKKVILYVGRLIKRKGIQYLLKAMAELKKEHGVCRLLIVGEGVYKINLQQIINELSLEKNVLFLGWIDNNELAPYYLLSDVFVVPSITEPISEPWGFVVNEAVNAGRPVVLTEAVGAVDELVIQDKNGFVVKERNSDELFEAIKKIIDNDDLARKMGQSSSEINHKFTPVKMAEGFKKAIESVI